MGTLISSWSAELHLQLMSEVGLRLGGRSPLPVGIWEISDLVRGVAGGSLRRDWAKER